MRRGAATLALALVAGLAAADEPPQLLVTPHNPDDAVGVRVEPGALSIDIDSPRGMGTVQVRLIEGSWPSAVRLRFHRLARFESLRVSAGEHHLRCGLISIEGGPNGHACRLDGEASEPVRPGDTYFDVWLPRRLLEAAAPLAIEWVDRWR